MIEILTKIRVKITIIVVESREPYYFLIIYKYTEIPLSLFSYQMLASIFDSDERSSYYKVYGDNPKGKVWPSTHPLLKSKVAEESLFCTEILPKTWQK